MTALVALATYCAKQIRNNPIAAPYVSNDCSVAAHHPEARIGHEERTEDITSLFIIGDAPPREGLRNPFSLRAIIREARRGWLEINDPPIMRPTLDGSLLGDAGLDGTKERNDARQCEAGAHGYRPIFASTLRTRRQLPSAACGSYIGRSAKLYP